MKKIQNIILCFIVGIFGIFASIHIAQNQIFITGGIGGTTTSTIVKNFSSTDYTGTATYSCPGDVQVVSCFDPDGGEVSYMSGNINGRVIKFDYYKGKSPDTIIAGQFCGGSCINVDTGKQIDFPKCATVTSTKCEEWK